MRDTLNVIREESLKKSWNYFFFLAFFVFTFLEEAFFEDLAALAGTGTGNIAGTEEGDLESDHSLTIISTTKPTETKRTTNPIMMPMKISLELDFDLL